MIKFQNINLSFNKKSVINNLVLKIKQGEKIIILGKSGSGKSSLLSLVLGFIKADSGEIIFDNERIDEKSIWNIRRKIAYIDQDVSLGTGKITEILDFISKLKSNTHLDFSQDKLEPLLEYFELPINILDKNIENLSGGERQRLAIIIGLLLKRNIFFLDEVTSALDKHLKKKVADYFLNKKEWTCIIISHDPVWLENPIAKVFNFEEKKWER